MSAIDDKLKAMKPSRLAEILGKAAEGKADLADVVEIVGATLVSMSRSNTEIKTIVQGLADAMQEMQEKVDFLYEHNSPIYAAVLEDEEEEEDSLDD
jgi:hypothetical protein